MIEASTGQHCGEKTPLLRTYPLREGEAESFGAICGGEATDPDRTANLNEAIFLIGAGHCAQPSRSSASDCGLFVTVVDDRRELTRALPPGKRLRCRHAQPGRIHSATARMAAETKRLLLVSRNYELDREALAAALADPAGPAISG